jgi:hypothetical protein
VSIRAKIHDGKHARRCNKRRLASDPSLTLSGVSYRDMRSVFTLASLRTHEELKRATAEKDEEAADWYRHMLALLHLLDEAILAGIDATFPKKEPPKPSKEERWLAIKAEAQSRDFMKDVLQRARDQRASKAASAEGVQ